MQHEILAGARDKIYPILQSILGRLDLLKKRAYVAKFILPVQMPPEYLHDETTQTLMEQLSVLQTEFRETHKALDAMREDLTDPGELRQEITQLESERRQLLGRIDDLKTKTAKMRGFQTVFDATSRLRKEQEEEVKLSDRLMEQRAALSQAEGRHKAAARKLAETRARSKEDMSAADLVASARREADDNARLLSKVLPEATEARRAALAALQAKISGPRRSMEDVAALQRRVRETEARLARAVEAQAERERPVDAKLPLFRQQSMLLARKHHDKAVEVERARRAMEEARAEVDRREAQVAETAGSRHMRKEELAAYAASVRTKLQLVKRLKGELAAMRSETAVLGRTEQLLKSRAGSELAETGSRSRGGGKPRCGDWRLIGAFCGCFAKNALQMWTRCSLGSRSDAACRGTPLWSRPSTRCPDRRSVWMRPRGRCWSESLGLSRTSRSRCKQCRPFSRSCAG